jgi:hypothetical protein
MTMKRVNLANIGPAPYRHPPFGEAYRPFFERLSKVFAEVYPQTPDQWEDGFRRDTHPDWEMGIWKDMADIFEHFVEAKGLDLDRKKELHKLVLLCVSSGERAARKEQFCVLARPLINEVIAYTTQKTGGRVRPMILGEK